MLTEPARSGLSFKQVFRILSDQKSSSVGEEWHCVMFLNFQAACNKQKGLALISVEICQTGFEIPQSKWIFVQ